MLKGLACDKVMEPLLCDYFIYENNIKEDDLFIKLQQMVSG